jgi:hypothetical protein
MVKPKKKRKGDAAQVAHSVMQDVIALTERPIKELSAQSRLSPPKKSRKL